MGFAINSDKVSDLLALPILQPHPAQSVLARPALDHDQLVCMGRPVGEAAALHDDAALAQLDGHALVDVSERIFARERPDRDVAADALTLVAGDAMVLALSFGEEIVAGLDLAKAPDRRLVLAAGAVFDIRQGAARPAAAADRLLLLQGAMPVLHAPPQRRQRTALEREAVVLLLGGAEEVDE